jgi:AcrR family transcriptional regulator
MSIVNLRKATLVSQNVWRFYLGAKGDRTKGNIIDASKKIFASRGYSRVTMKDICEVCGLSRGGLYRHFSSTKEIFMAMLDNDINDSRIAVEESIKNGVPAKVIFDYYLQYERDAIVSESHGIYFAIHEFAFVEKDKRDYFKKRLMDSIEILSILFEYGQREEEFKEFDIDVVASHILYFFDSLKTSAPVFEPDKEMIEKQIKLIMEMVI